ncbi:MAG: hypothetical protein IIC10_01725, partial [Proteobacteria bacterium]|nr:hypothetical protein [Pseudomonadota bacterium]
MATSVPLIEIMLQSVVTALGNISVANNYRTNVSIVSRVFKDIDEIDTADVPALFVILPNKEISSQTNREVENRFNILIYGYVHIDEFSNNVADNASQKIINLTSDVEEKM